jgi:hypothetical protein
VAWDVAADAWPWCTASRCAGLGWVITGPGLDGGRGRASAPGARGR